MKGKKNKIQEQNSQSDIDISEQQEEEEEQQVHSSDQEQDLDSDQDSDDEIQELLHPKNQQNDNLLKSLNDINSGRVIGRTKQHFYGADGDQQDDQEKGQIQINDEYAEAMRLQKFKAAKLKSFANQVTNENALTNQEHDGATQKAVKDATHRNTKQRLMQIIRQEGSDQSDPEQAVVKKNKTSKSKKPKQPRQLTIKDASQFGMLLSQLAKSAQDLSEQVQPLLKSSYAKIGTESGMSYLDVKNSLLLSYMINLTFYMILKAKGKTIEDHPVILRLAYLKTLLQKLRPLDSKLQYQIQKAVQLAKGSSSMKLQEKDFKPRPSEMISGKLQQMEGQVSDEEDEEEQIKSSKYQAPMMNATLTDKQLAKQRKKLKAGKKNLARTALMQQIHQEMYDIPQQTFERQDYNKKEIDQEDKINQYQENQFKRVTLGKDMKMKIKKQKKEAKQQIKMKAGLDGLSLNQITNALNKNKENQMELQAAQRRLLQEQAMKESIYRTQVGRSLLKARKKVHEKGGAAAQNQQFNDFDLGEPSMKKKKKKRVEKNIEVDNDIDDEFYKNQMSQMTKSKKEKKQKAQEIRNANQAELLNKHQINQRNINYRMLKNKGLTRNRKKQDSNPRVKLHNKFKKAQKKRKHLVQEAIQQKGNYQGQETGLRTTIIKSRPLDG